MSESIPFSPEASQPPYLTELEAQTALAIQQSITASRLDVQGNELSREGTLGITSDGTLISVEEVLRPQDQSEGPNYTYVVRTGNLAELAAGSPLSEETPSRVVKFSSSGPSLTTSIGRVSYGDTIPMHTSREDTSLARLKSLSGERMKIYPIGPDGQPFDPTAPVLETQADQPEVTEQPPVDVQPAQVVIGSSRRGFFRRRK